MKQPNQLIHKRTLKAITIIVSIALCSSTAIAHHKKGKTYHNKYDYKHSKQHFYDYAKVVSAQPIYQSIEHRVPVTSCNNISSNHKKYRDHRHQNITKNSTPVIIGGLLGGALGNELGHKKSNKRVGAVVGTILGASIASDISNKRYAKKENYHQRNCQTHYDYQYEDQIVGYNVKYYYRGQHHRVRTSEHPGRRIQLKLSFSPITS